MSKESQNIGGIGLEYDPNDRVLRIIPVSPDGRSQTIEMTRDQAIDFYRVLGEMLSPDLDG